MITGSGIYLITLPRLAMLINNSSIYTSLRCNSTSYSKRHSQW
ncbi:hypothetical protein HMPREF3233_00839 [Veillonella atypica]|uniref:Uncharacterized protein n=1 Tax=Veillonella atypica TaxID=39777 RepID=A0A133S5B4_9FIRM|nr:hypothetical protein HMPREF3233_00839 [Veillonella atypica]